MKALHAKIWLLRAVWSYAAATAMTGCGHSPRMDSHARAGVPSGGNVLIIIADDLGKDKVGCYGKGKHASRPKTPHIDRLAAEGVRFVNAYSNPLCSPTRATMLTGRYSFRYGIGWAIFHLREGAGLPLAEVSIPEMLDQARSGYDHSLVGKWHLGTDARSPLLHGFNWAAGSRANLYPDQDYFGWDKDVNGETVRTNVYATTDTTNDAIERANAMREPWFMWLAYNAPHKLFHVPPAHLHTHDDPDRNNRTRFAAMTEAMDSEIGRLLCEMRAEVRENTTIIFLGDNGTPKVVARPAARLRSKTTVYESGVNIPFIVWGKAVPRAARGEVSEALVNTTDVFATVADIAGVDLERVLPPGHKLDSMSLLPALADPDGAGRRRYAFAESFRPNGPPPYRNHHRMIRGKRWKLIEHYVGRARTRRELYDLSAAPPGLDGDDLCPCPENLDADAQAAYERLVRALQEIDKGG